MQYEILTTQSVYNKTSYEDLCEEQDALLQKNGLMGELVIHFFSTDAMETMLLSEAFDSLLIKDGVDLVRFSTGNFGFVGYYNNHKDMFEIIGTAKDVASHAIRLDALLSVLPWSQKIHVVADDGTANDRAVAKEKFGNRKVKEVFTEDEGLLVIEL